MSEPEQTENGISSPQETTPAAQLAVTSSAPLPPQPPLPSDVAMPPQHTEALLHGQKRLLSLIDSLPGIVFTGSNDLDWSMTYMSRGCLAITGYHPHELVGSDRPQTYNDIIHPADLPGVLAEIAAAIAQHQPYVTEYRIRTKTGEEKWLWEKGYGVFDAEGRILGIEGFITDITSLKLSEQALRESEARFRTLYENAAVGVGVTTIQGDIVHVNSALQAMLGYTLEEFTAKNFVDFTHPDDRAEDVALFQDLVAGRRNSYTLEKRYIRQDGEVVWARLSVSVVRNDQGESLFSLALVEDITERKQTEAALLESEALTQDLLRALPDMLFLIGEDGTYRYIQAEQQDDLVLPLEQLLGQRIEDVLPADVYVLMRDRMAQALQGEVQPFVYELQVAKGLQYFESRISFSKGLGYVVMARNVTERRLAEQALLEKEAFLRLILDNIPQYIFWKDRDLVYRGANQIFAESAGYSSPADILGKNDVELWGEEQARVFQARDRQVMEEDTPQLHLIRCKTLADGQVIWQDVSKVPIHDAQGNVIGVLGTCENITDRRRAEEALAKREQYLAALVEVQQQLLAYQPDADTYGQVLERLGNMAAACRVTAFEYHSDADHPGHCVQVAQWTASLPTAFPPASPDLADGFCHPLHHHALFPRWLAAFAQHCPIVSSAQDLPADEQQALSEQGMTALLALPLLIKGHLAGFLMFENYHQNRVWEPSEVDLLRAATAALSLAFERHQAEVELRRSEVRYRLLAEHSTDLISWHRLDGTYRYASPACRSLLGYEPQDLIGRSCYELFHPDDLDLIQQSHQMAIAFPDQDVAPFSYRIRHKDGHYIWFETTGKSILDANSGQVKEIVAISRDVTKRKQAELLLAGQKRVLEMIATNADLTETLNVLIKTIESLAEGVIGSVLLLDADGVHVRHGAAPSLPADYVQAVDGAAIGPQAGSCGSAMYYKTAVIVADIASDPLWENYRDLALRYGLRACWSMPICSSQGTVLGSFGLYYHETRTPTDREWQLIETATQMAGIAIERYLAAMALQEAEAKYRSIFENSVEGIFQSTLEGRYSIVNSMLARIYGYDSPDELLSTLTDISTQLYVNPERRQEFVRLMQKQSAVWGFESQVYRKDGTKIWISECARALYNAQGDLIGYEGTVVDITQRKQTEAELLKRDDLLQSVAEATSGLLTLPDLDGAIAEALALLGQAAKVDRAYIFENHPHPVTGEPCMSMRYEWVQQGVQPAITQTHWQNQSYQAFGLNRWYEAFQKGEAIRGAIACFSQQEQLWMQQGNSQSVLIVPIFVEDALWGFIGFDDCQQQRVWSASEESILVAIAASIGGAIKRQQTEERMRYQAFHDTLTGLPNRMMFDNRLALALAHARRAGELLAVMFLDLDRFKTINDTLGHAIGDELLQQATQRLTRSLREEDTIARWGGDEFTVLLPGLSDPDDAARIAQRISEAMRPCFFLDEQELHISCSIGIAIYPYNGRDADTLLKNADAALYRAKEQGRNNFQFYTASINSRASERLTLDSSLHYALERNEFVVYYQPQVNILNGEITQMEVLLRWEHPQLGLISPQTFITLAEENGMIFPIGEWVLRAACTQYQQWHAAGVAPQRIAVNLSARQFQQPQLVSKISQILKETGLPPHCLELEITETAAMRDVEFSIEMLHDLKAMGVRISMDDFGTGYSSLNYLKRFPLHALKIDRSFVQDLTFDSHDEAIISAIITLGHGLNLNVIAEGVETLDQMAKLQSLQCQEMQGYLFSPPLPVEVATQFLTKNLVPCHWLLQEEATVNTEKRGFS